MAVVYRLFAPARTVFYAGFMALFMGLCAVSGAAAQEEEIYTVSGVKVDITAGNAVEAREKAFTEAQVLAFRELAERILVNTPGYEMPDMNVISNLIQDYEVTDEQLSAVRYKGTYTFRFRPEAVRNFFSVGGLSYSDVARKPTLVLPFYMMGSRSILWEEGNPFMAAWARSVSASSMVPVIVPIGDLLDVSQIGDDQALTYDPSLLEHMIDRYEAGSAVIMIAEPVPAPDNLIVLNISLYDTDGPVPSFIRTVTVRQTPGEDLNAFFNRTVTETRAAMRIDWKTETTVVPGQVSMLQAKVRFGSPQEWVKIQQSLQQMPVIRSMKVIGLKPREADVAIEYAGNEDGLRLALRQVDIMLKPPGLQYGDSSRHGYKGQQPYEIYLSRYQ